MRFARPDLFLWLWMAALIAVFLWLSFKRKKRIAQKFARQELFTEISGQYHSGRDFQKRMILICVFLLSLIALARPQWGFEWQEVKREGLDILIAIDTSKSMLTEDVKPNRLERTKLAVKDLIRGLSGDRIGLIAFSGQAFLTCPLTVDYNGFLLSLNDLDTGTIPVGGTSLDSAIREAMKTYEKIPTQYKALVLITDGENWEGDPVKTAQEARSKGIRIFTIGIGTNEGELIRLNKEQGGQYLKDNQGNYVKSRLNEELLQRVALETGGIYVRASGAEFGLDLIYEKELSKMEKRESESKMEKKYHERFQIPLGLAVLALIFETFLTTKKKDE